MSEIYSHLILLYYPIESACPSSKNHIDYALGKLRSNNGPKKIYKKLNHKKDREKKQSENKKVRL